MITAQAVGTTIGMAMVAGGVLYYLVMEVKNRPNKTIPERNLPPVLPSQFFDHHDNPANLNIRNKIQTSGPVLLVQQNTLCVKCQAQMAVTAVGVSNWVNLSETGENIQFSAEDEVESLLLLPNLWEIPHQLKGFFKEHAPHFHGVSSKNRHQNPLNHCPECGHAHSEDHFYKIPGSSFYPPATERDINYLRSLNFIKITVPGPFTFEGHPYWFANPADDSSPHQCGICHKPMPDGPWEVLKIVPASLLGKFVCKECYEKLPSDANLMYSSGKELFWDGRDEFQCDKCNHGMSEFIYDPTGSGYAYCMKCAENKGLIGT